MAALLVGALLGALLGTVPASNSPAAAANPFTDVPAGAFFTSAVDWLAGEGITTGTTATTFSPDDPVTRGQMAAFLERYAQVEGDPGQHGFADVPAGAFYDGSVSFLVERSVTTGTTATTFSPDDPVTRAQMATFLWRFSLEPAPSAAMPFNDVPTGTYYYQAVRWLAGKGITTGTTATTYSPNDTVTRGQMATFLWRLAKQPSTGEKGANRIDPTKTVIGEADDLGPATSIDSDGVSALDWEGSDEPQVGEIVVLGVTDETPEGFIGKVTSTSGDMVTTAPASLQEAIPEADVAGSFDFDALAEPGSGLAPSSISDAFENVTAKCSGGGKLFEVETDLSLDSGLDLEVSWDPFGEGIAAYIGFSATATATIDVEVSGEIECEAVVSVDGPKLRAITFWIGPVPVVLTPEISFEAEIGGSFAASASAGYTYSQTVGAGLRYSDARGWSTEYTNTRDSFFRPPTFAAQLTAGIELRARLDVKAYGVGGPYLTLGPFFELNAQNNIPWWNIDAGLRAAIGASIDVFFFQDEVQFAEIDLVRFRLADSGVTPFPGGFQFLEGIPLTSVEVGGATACGIDAGGSVHCWGDNFWGQIGDGTTLQRTSATRVPGINDAVEVASGGSHTCARHADGTISCWGDNMFGELGDGTETDRLSPVKVTGIDDATRVVTGTSNSCAILEDMTVKCWGRNDNGQVGVSSGDTDIPRRVPGLDIVTDLTIGQSFACALRATGDVRCWGYNYDGNLGNGRSGVDEVFNPTPVSVSNLSDAIDVESSGLSTCATRINQTVVCWGAGPLGSASTTRSTVPVPVAGLTGVTDLSVGYGTACVVLDDDQLRCWGSDFNGELGNGAPNVDSPTPVAVAGGTGFEAVSSAGGTICGEYGFDVAICWGDNEFGTIGDGTTTDRSAPLNRVQNPSF